MGRFDRKGRGPRGIGREASTGGGERPCLDAVDYWNEPRWDPRKSSSSSQMRASSPEGVRVI